MGSSAPKTGKESRLSLLALILKRSLGIPAACFRMWGGRGQASHRRACSYPRRWEQHSSLVTLSPSKAGRGPLFMCLRRRFLLYIPQLPAMLSAFRDATHPTPSLTLLCAKESWRVVTPATMCRRLTGNHFLAGTALLQNTHQTDTLILLDGGEQFFHILRRKKLV